MKPTASVNEIRKKSRLASIAASYGVCLVLSGVWRVVSAEGGYTGLIFGLVTGGLALVAGWLFRLGGRWPIVASIFIGISLLFAGGWFCYEALIDKGIANAEPRQLIMIAISIITAIGLVVVSRSSRSNIE